MHFEVYPWELTKRLEKNLTQVKGCYNFFYEDPFFNKLTHQVLKSFFQSPLSLKIILGHEVNKDWIHDNLIELGLFGPSEVFLVHNAEEISSKVRDYLLEKIPLIMTSAPYLFLSHNKLDEGQAKKIKTLDGVSSFNVRSPKFWEMGKLFDFFSYQINLKFSMEAKDYLLKAIENTAQEFDNVLNFLKLIYPQNEILTLLQVQQIVDPFRLDQFALGLAFSEKKFKVFFEEILKREINFDALRSLFAFMQGHLLKMAEASSLQKKGKNNKYEQEILRCSQFWTGNELLKALRLMGNLEILAKQRAPFLKSQLCKLRLQEALFT